jgi:hypothetical protein
MPKSTFLALLFTILLPIPASANTDSLPLKYLSLGPRKAGICFGNSPVYTGFRFNLISKNVKRVNIFDLSLVSADSGKTNGISIGAAINVQDRNNGLSIGSIFNVLRQENGIMIGPMINLADKVNGVEIAIVFKNDILNGLAIGHAMMERNSEDSITSRINGMALCVFSIEIDEVKGVAISAYNHSQAHKGLSIGGVNRTSRLKGVQIGLYNVALNNPKGFRRLPLINVHLGK